MFPGKFHSKSMKSRENFSHATCCSKCSLLFHTNIAPVQCIGIVISSKSPKPLPSPISQSPNCLNLLTSLVVSKYFSSLNSLYVVFCEVHQTNTSSTFPSLQLLKCLSQFCVENTRCEVQVGRIRAKLSFEKFKLCIFPVKLFFSFLSWKGFLIVSLTLPLEKNT